MFGYDRQDGIVVPGLILEHVFDPMVDDKIGNDAEDGSNLLNVAGEGLEKSQLCTLIVAHIVERNPLGKGAPLDTTFALFKQRRVLIPSCIVIGNMI